MLLLLLLPPSEGEGTRTVAAQQGRESGARSPGVRGAVSQHAAALEAPSLRGHESRRQLGWQGCMLGPGIPLDAIPP